MYLALDRSKELSLHYYRTLVPMCVHQILFWSCTGTRNHPPMNRYAIVNRSVNLLNYQYRYRTVTSFSRTSGME